MDVKRTRCSWEPAFDRVEPIDRDGNSLGIVYFERIGPGRPAGGNPDRSRPNSAVQQPARNRMWTVTAYMLAISFAAVLIVWLGAASP